MPIRSGEGKDAETSEDSDGSSEESDIDIDTALSNLPEEEVSDTDQVRGAAALPNPPSCR